jgi:hypothetical protein
MPNCNLHLIRARKSYTVNEIAGLLAINRKTCTRWIKNEGLRVIEENATPLLVMGRDLIDFIKKKRAKKRTPLKENEYYCMKCRKAVRARTGSEQTIKTGKRIGKNDQEQYKKTGICENCGIGLNKFLGVCQQD